MRGQRTRGTTVGQTTDPVEIAISPKGDGGVTITVAHTKLPSPGHVSHWRQFWSEWFAALDEASG